MTERSCVVCGHAATSNVCEGCADELDTPTTFVAEQILSSWARPLDGALVDRWGRVHRLEASTRLGRVLTARGVVVMHGAVSRHHATLTRDAAGQWTVTDAGSSNGTRVNDRALTAPTPLRHGDRLTFGSVGLYFAHDDGSLVDASLDEVASLTVRPDAGLAVAPLEEELIDPDETTFSGMPTVELRFLEAPSGGGGYLEVRGRQVQLTDTQFAMLAMMARRMSEEPTISSLVRGFVPTGQLIADLPWDAHQPSENHLKQLVRRTRKALALAGIGNLIESRRLFGYRLRVVPASAAP